MIVGIVIFVLLVWGLIGSYQVSEVRNTCDIGINGEGNLFCWTWHQNIPGDIQEGFEDMVND